MGITEALMQLEVGQVATFYDLNKANSIRVLANRVAKIRGCKFKTHVVRQEAEHPWMDVERVV